MSSARHSRYLCLRLQWGRTDEGAEIATQLVWIVAGVTLQWGRTDEGAEMRRGTRTRRECSGSFNGAAPMKVRRL